MRSLCDVVKRLMNGARNLVKLRLLHPWVRYGRNVHVQFNCRLWSPHRKIVIGDNVGIGNHCVIITDVIIGNNVLIASHVGLVARDAHISQVGKTIFESPRGDQYEIVIEDDVWIGHGAIILSGVTIGKGSIVAAGALVVHNVPPYSIVGIKPAEVIGWRFTNEEIASHERLLAGGAVNGKSNLDK